MRNNGTNRDVSPTTSKIYVGQTIRTYIPGYGNVRAYVRSLNQLNGMAELDIQTVYGSWQPIQVHYSNLIEPAQPPVRINLYEVLNCMNNWVKINLVDGTVITAFLKSINMNRVEGFVSHNAYKSITCQGKVITNEEEAKPCINRWVTVMLHNGISLSFYLTRYDRNYVGGYLRVSELLPLLNQVESIDCLRKWR
ncbi:hypothetical protein VQL36_08205 [Chengkuizengella sp. SCS-71B]|uniref:hypothetical protein n=1 Tax=Chengkuizengella sp. SCS-71B TaxID=3115290 RepID=UPI0032C21E62